MRRSPLLRPIEPSAGAGVLRWDDDVAVPVYAGDTISAALLRHGVVATTRSLKYRRPRAPWCLQGDCGTCMVRVDGLPNRRACRTPAHAGMNVAPQNVLGVAGIDPSGVMDRVLGAALDHHHFVVRPKLANTIMQGVARQLAGLGTLPDAAAAHAEPASYRACDVLVIGMGPAGQAAAACLRAAGVDVIAVDREPQPAAESLAAVGAYPIEGLVLAVTGEGADAQAHALRPRHLLIATGTRDTLPILGGNDVPGVFAARGLAGLLERHALAPAGPLALIGDPDDPSGFVGALADRLGTAPVAPTRVRAIEGRERVRGLIVDGRTQPAAIVATALVPAPASELGRQAGAAPRWIPAPGGGPGGGFALARDPDSLRVTTVEPAPWTLWAAGGVCGPDAGRHASADGEAVARAIVRALAQAGLGAAALPAGAP